MPQRGSAVAGAGVTWELGVSAPWANHVERYSKSRLPQRPSWKREKHGTTVESGNEGGSKGFAQQSTRSL